MNVKFDYIAYADGGSRNNPGEAAYGFVIYNGERKELFKNGKRIGVATNNVAEYMGVVEALKWILQSSKTKNPIIEFYVDSTLIANQLMGRFKIKNENLRSLVYTVKLLEQKLGTTVQYKQIPRAQNKVADEQVNLALDNLI